MESPRRPGCHSMTYFWDGHGGKGKSQVWILNSLNLLQKVLMAWVKALMTLLWLQASRFIRGDSRSILSCIGSFNKKWSALRHIIIWLTACFHILNFDDFLADIVRLTYCMQVWPGVAQLLLLSRCGCRCKSRRLILLHLHGAGRDSWVWTDL